MGNPARPAARHGPLLTHDADVAFPHMTGRIVSTCVVLGRGAAVGELTNENTATRTRAQGGAALLWRRRGGALLPPRGARQGDVQDAPSPGPGGGARPPGHRKDSTTRTGSRGVSPPSLKYKVATPIEGKRSGV